MNSDRDVFLCHAHEDKDRFVYPFLTALKSFAISYWLDEGEIRWGDDIVRKVNEGMAISRFVIVFLTEAFLRKEFAQKELANALALEARTRRVTVLPVLAASEEDLFHRYPLLTSKKYVRWADGPAAIASQLATLLGRENRTRWLFHYPAEYSGPVWTAFVVQESNLGTTHNFRITWGPWVKKGHFTTANDRAIALVYAKGDDGLSIPVFVHVTPACYTYSGTGDVPTQNALDINEGWTRRDQPSAT